MHRDEKRESKSDVRATPSKSRRRFVARLVKAGTVAVPVVMAASIQSRAHAS